MEDKSHLYIIRWNVPDSQGNVYAKGDIEKALRHLVSWYNLCYDDIGLFYRSDYLKITLSEEEYRKYLEDKRIQASLNYEKNHWNQFVRWHDEFVGRELDAYHKTMPELKRMDENGEISRDDIRAMFRMDAVSTIKDLMAEYENCADPKGGRNSYQKHI